MTERDHSKAPASYDPKSWAKGPRTAEGGDDAPSTSFDPTTWVSKESTRPPPPARSPRVGRRGLIALAGSVLAGGVGLAILRRPKPRPRPVGQTTAPEERRTVSLRGSEDLAVVVQRLGASSADAAEAARLVEQAVGRPSSIVVSFSGLGPLRRLTGLDATAADGTTAHMRRVQDGFQLTRGNPPRGLVARVVRGQMDDRDFFSSAVARGLNDILVPVFTKALSYDLDFAREVAPSDLFEAVIEERRDSFGAVIGEPRLLYAGFHHAPVASARVSETDGIGSDRPKTAELYNWGQGPDKEPRWFDANGASARRSLMRTPIEGGHITSVFGLRLHPVLGFFRAHKGIDFGAPKNTSVFAAGDGQIEFAGPHGGHGNYLQVRHSPTLSTAYGHLDRFVEGLKLGDQVRQGQQIAWSGNSGVSTGPHLHYEVIVNGEQVDPLSYADAGSGMGLTLTGSELEQFLSERRRIDKIRTTQL